MTEEKCPYCDDGIVERVLNWDGYLFDCEYPEITTEYCEECGGTGYYNEETQDEIN
jgi:hypothetical protein